MTEMKKKNDESKTGNQKMTPANPPQYFLNSRIFHIENTKGYKKYEDAYAPREEMSGILSTDRGFAVADGVTGALPSEKWASLLADEAAAACGINFLTTDRLKILREQWLTAEIDQAQKKYCNDPQRMREFSRLIRRDCASSTLHLLVLKPSGEYISESIGDSTLFVFSKGKITQQNPPYTAEDYMRISCPPQILSSAAQDTNWKISCREGTFSAGDIFLLVSDGLAKYIVEQEDSEMEMQRIKALLSISTQKDFCDFITRERDQSYALHDDITAVIITVS